MEWLEFVLSKNSAQASNACLKKVDQNGARERMRRSRDHWVFVDLESSMPKS